MTPAKPKTVLKKPTQPVPDPEKLNVVVNGTQKHDALFGTAGNDTVYGGNGNDMLHGPGLLGTTDGQDALYGGAGDDTLFGGAGNDIFNGGEGKDTVIFFSDILMLDAPVGAVVNLNLQGAQNTGYGLETFLSIENLVGTSNGDRFKGDGADNSFWGEEGRDILSGGNGNDFIEGGEDNDTLCGDRGNDTLFGGMGNDKLTGGAGRDTFGFHLKQKAKGGVDTITDFKRGEDKFFLEHPLLKASGEKGLLAEKAFHIGSSAENADTRIFYNEDTGAVYFDIDGTGAQVAIQIAQVGKHLALKNTDFLI